VPVTHPLLDLQAADTLTDQLRHRRSHLPEQAAADAARGALTAWERDVATRRTRLAELDTEIEADEARSHAIDEHRARLSKQLKTVIAVREAEALQHEMANLGEQRSALDDAELAALEEQSRIDDELTALASQEPDLRRASAEAEAALAAATAEVDAELERLAVGRDELRAAVAPALLRQYDEVRPQFGGVAAAALVGARCEGCHLDLSAGEVDVVKAAAAGNAGVTECPNCGRLLVVG
jgi:predicted  nucleic acid-binding Zn-ribbon protein